MIQIDMPMPENCFECPVCNEYLCCAIPVGGHGWGENNVSDFSKSRPEWCPLKEQEAKRGKWIPVTNGRGGMECSICHDYAPNFSSGLERLSLYCPNCGAKMKAVKWDA